ncbi:MAG TPA: ABC transporter ATP-binding protein [Roseiflexaceae bacterium]|nr:ABC transporter ATP-binding protein [Roseiflexaceae bacterium]
MEAIIQVRNLTRTYRTGEIEVRALRGVSFDIQSGEFVAIMGPSGSGKSTLMNVIGCLDTPTSGEYLLGGLSVQQMSKDELSAVRNYMIGFVFQQFHLLPRSTALANVELPLVYQGVPAGPARLKRAKAALGAVGLGARMQHRPRELSGGQQQRVAIARALVTNPVLLLADEPTGNLDTQASEEIMALLSRLNAEGLTIVLITHEPDVARAAHRVLTIRDGMLASDVRQQEEVAR